MDIRTISAALAILGSGLPIVACTRASADLSEVPGSRSAAAPVKLTEDPVRSAAPTAVPADPSPEDHDSPSADEALPATGNTADATLPVDPALVESDARVATPKVIKKRPASKPARKKAQGEMTCGEGRCGEGRCG